MPAVRTLREGVDWVQFPAPRQKYYLTFENKKIMDTNDKKIKEIRKVETVINENLFLICMIVTFATMALMVVNFFSRGCFFPTKIGLFYLTVVLIYSLHKEFVRWLGEKKSRRQGEYFVYAWIILTTSLYIINFFSNNYFDHSKEGYTVSTLADVSYTAIEVLGIFIVTRVMKILFTFKK
jgi:hypothetical protein